jgi:hypothetical protein
MKPALGFGRRSCFVAIMAVAMWPLVPTVAQSLSQMQACDTAGSTGKELHGSVQLTQPEFFQTTNTAPSLIAVQGTPRLNAPGRQVEKMESLSRRVVFTRAIAEQLPAPFQQQKSKTAQPDTPRTITDLTFDPAPASSTLAKETITGPAAEVFDRAGIVGLNCAPARYAPNCFGWAAPAFYHNPLYFEEPNLERYGHYYCCNGYRCCYGDCLQSAVSTAHFFGTVPFMPYKIGADPCCERQYTLGWYRPGSCNPHQIIYPEKSFCGLVYQGLVTGGAIWAIP